MSDENKQFNKIYINTIEESLDNIKAMLAHMKANMEAAQ